MTDMWRRHSSLPPWALRRGADTLVCRVEIRLDAFGMAPTLGTRDGFSTLPGEYLAGTEVVR
jgi:hypothetical protein